MKTKRIQTEPEYKTSNPKIDLLYRIETGGLHYWRSTNHWRTCRDALVWFRATYPEQGLVKAVIDHA